ncbi:5-dehydro-4-deoxy-D-glucuronate isomerase [Erysipelothrix sp. HDW6B]|uniref:5-dehydro-4-deoxy-D-glucuronate isomerase n=1 Tax=Erysipelothrix sp. HDW6B TaxID=2714929 RepID=UPI001F0F4CA6|nr:5-dehydro-4-deoxy-D-glucuronate isomerase [Erysipelothrix sp. HDW6B]
MKLETRYAASPREMERLNTTELREQYLVESIFIPGDILLTYTHNDRMIFGGVTPTTTPLEIVLSTELGVDYFLERRELGVINIGGSGSITIEGETFAMEKQDGFYIGKETKDIQFMSNDASNPAKFYVVSVPAHKKYPNIKISIDQITPRLAGEAKSMNDREIFQYIHPNVCESCQLQMGYTILKEGSSWNTMPSHTHERRMETYLYFDIPEGNRVFHFMGQPQETRHLLVSNEQACISPSWSIHTGVATSNYSFIWSMCGENITYDDMDHVAMEDLR